jgi:hypothetical protein
LYWLNLVEKWNFGNRTMMGEPAYLELVLQHAGRASELSVINGSWIIPARQVCTTWAGGDNQISPSAFFPHSLLQSGGSLR